MPSGPVRKIRSPSVSSTGRTCANASSSCPPTISDSVPDSARVIPPETGASITRMPAGARSRASALVPTGSDELMSSTTAPGLSAAAIAAVPAEDGLAHGAAVGEHGHDDPRLGERLRRVGGLPAVRGDEPLLRAGVAVPDHEREAGRGEVGGHAAAHVADADEPDRGPPAGSGGAHSSPSSASTAEALRKPSTAAGMPQ